MGDSLLPSSKSSLLFEIFNATTLFEVQVVPQTLVEMKYLFESVVLNIFNTYLPYKFSNLLFLYFQNKIERHYSF